MERLKKWVGNKIKARREELEINQEQLAAAIGTHQTRISKWESGRHIPDEDYIKKLMEVLSVDESFFDPETVSTFSQDPKNNELIIVLKTEFKALKEELGAKMENSRPELAETKGYTPRQLKALDLLLSVDPDIHEFVIARHNLNPAAIASFFLPAHHKANSQPLKSPPREVLLNPAANKSNKKKIVSQK